ncbi:hypothetical protein N7G274_005136 [Stereocaulon virgatum]|uniref:Uncharacterized protein n=1 Tax=Stereocaulon virgatum TaxID=373712 RepID=A0ABR4AEY0_9LECA
MIMVYVGAGFGMPGYKMAEKALERHARYIRSLDIQFNWREVQMGNRELVKDLDASLRSCRAHLFDSQHLRSIGVTLQIWIGLWPLVIYPLRRIPLPNIIAENIAAVSLDDVKDNVRLREDRHSQLLEAGR